MANVVTRPTAKPARAIVIARVQSRSSAGTSLDLALLASAFFLQRFSLAFGHSLMSLDAAPTALILIYLFASGRVLIIYDRLLWFLALGLAAADRLEFPSIDPPPNPGLSQTSLAMRVLKRSGDTGWCGYPPRQQPQMSIAPESDLERIALIDPL